MSVAQVRPDPTFYASPRLAIEAPQETLAYVALLRPDRSEPDALAVVELDRRSPQYGKMASMMPFTHRGDELHHYGWNACSAALCPMTGHPFTERRYLIVPGLRSSRIYVVDTRPDPRKPRIVKEIPPEEMLHKTGYSRPHTVHCGPEGVYISTLGARGEHGDQGVPGIFLLDCESFDIRGKWEMDRGPQKMSYDFWWNIPHDYLVSSEWGLPPMFENGLVPELLLANRYGHCLHFWDLRSRRNVQTIDLGANHQMALEVRPAHDPGSDHGFLGVVVDTTNLEGSVWTWWREDGTFHARKTATIPAEPAAAAELPEALKPFGAAPPLVSDIDLSLDDRFLYVACWGTGELRQYDVTDPMQPRLAGSVRLGGVARHTSHPGGQPFHGGPQMIEIGRDGRRVYFTNSLYSSWDEQFYPAGVHGQMAMANVGADGGLTLDPNFLLDFPAGFRSHQIRLEGGDCSTESFCFASA